MSKKANTDHPIQDILAERWSPRAFSEKAVESENLLSTLEAVRWAASSYNEQPWRIILASKNEAGYDDLFACLDDFNKTWAKSAPVLLLFATQKTFSQNGKPNSHAEHDIGAAVANLALQATAQGLHTHAMSGFSRDEARQRFDIPAGFEPVTMVALGYLGDPTSLPEKFQDMERATRSRKPLSDLVYGATWEGSSPIL